MYRYNLYRNCIREYVSALDSAKIFLHGLLAEGELSKKQIEDDAKGAGHSWGTVRRAKDAMGIKSAKSKLDQCWYWSLASNLSENIEGAQHAHTNYMSTLPTEVSSWEEI